MKLGARVYVCVCVWISILCEASRRGCDSANGSCPLATPRCLPEGARSANGYRPDCSSTQPPSPSRPIPSHPLPHLTAPLNITLSCWEKVPRENIDSLPTKFWHSAKSKNLIHYYPSSKNNVGLQLTNFLNATKCSIHVKHFDCIKDC